jgi:hypothetical protein
MKARVRIFATTTASLIFALPASAAVWEPHNVVDRLTGSETPGLITKSVGEGRWALISAHKTQGLAVILATKDVTGCSPTSGCELPVKIGKEQSTKMKFTDLSNKAVVVRGPGARQIRQGLADGKTVLVEVTLFNKAPIVFTLSPADFDNSFDAPKE